MFNLVIKKMEFTLNGEFCLFFIGVALFFYKKIKKFNKSVDKSRNMWFNKQAV